MDYKNETLNKMSKININSIDIELIDFLKNGRKIKIKPENKGKFTKKAQSHGLGVQEFARKVLANKDKYSTSTIKQANFARNFGGKK